MISKPRSQVLREAGLTTPSRAWRPALDMANAEIAELPFQPKGWKHEPLRLNRAPGPRRRGRTESGPAQAPTPHHLWHQQRGRTE